MDEHLVVRVTERGIFRDCRRRWFWEHVEHYAPRKVPVPLWLGTGVHLGLQAYYATGAQAMLEGYNAWLEREFQNFEIQLGALWTKVRSEYEQAGDQGRQMLENYARFDSVSPLPGRILDALELELEVFVEDVNATLRGRIDLLIEDQLQQLWVVDHKTYSSFPTLGGIDVDDQFTAYVYLVWRVLQRRPIGIIGNVLLKATPEFPRVLKSGQLSRDKAQRTTYELYLQAIKDANLRVEDYADFLEYLRERGMKPFFERYTTLRSQAGLLLFEQHLKREISDMRSVRAHPELAYPNGHFSRCGWCPFLLPCRVWQSGGDPSDVLESNFIKTYEKENKIEPKSFPSNTPG